MATNEYNNIELVGSLDRTATIKRVNQDIAAINKSLKELTLTAKLDPNQVKAIQSQLNKLSLQLPDISIPSSSVSSVVNDLVSQLKKALIANAFKNTGKPIQVYGRQIICRIVLNMPSIPKNNLQGQGCVSPVTSQCSIK